MLGNIFIYNVQLYYTSSNVNMQFVMYIGRQMRINISTNPECYEYPLKLAVHTYLYAHVSVRISTLTYAYTSTCVYVHAHATVKLFGGVWG